MNLIVSLDWRFVVALGLAASSVILVSKLDSSAAEQVSIHAIDAGASLVRSDNEKC